MADNTAGKQPAHLNPEVQFRPGQSGNPKGRPQGSRNKLGEDFLDALHADFKASGKEAIVTVRKEKPDQYLKVIAMIVPKDLNLNVNNFDGMSDDELRDELRGLAATLAAFVGDPTSEGDNEGTRPETAH